MVFLSQLLFAFDSIAVLRPLDDGSVRSDPRRDIVDFRLKCQLFVHLLTNELFLNLLLEKVFVVKAVDFVVLCLLLAAWVSLANHFADEVDLRLELVDGFLGVLVLQGFSFLPLPVYKLGLAGLKVFVVTLVHVVLVGEDLARI